MEKIQLYNKQEIKTPINIVVATDKQVVFTHEALKDVPHFCKDAQVIYVLLNLVGWLVFKEATHIV